jgi:hypothetical protein
MSFGHVARFLREGQSNQFAGMCDSVTLLGFYAKGLMFINGAGD